MMNKIAFTSIWLVMVTVLLILCPPVRSISPNYKKTISSGLEIGKGIAELIGKKEFGEFLNKIGKNVGPYLGAIGPFMGLITALFPVESKELAYMKKMMKAIDKRFDKMDKRFDDIEQLIKWNVVQFNFGQIEQRIKAMAREFGYLYSVPSEAVENRKKIYISNYESDYQNSGTKLYQSIINKQGMFQEDLGTSVLRYTDNDRKKTQVFLFGVMQLLLQAVKVELAYLYLNKYSHNAIFMKAQWTSRIQEVQKKFNDTDAHCINVYLSESKEDINEYYKNNYKKINSQFADGLFNLLSKKYYWRDWIVVSYIPHKKAGLYHCATVDLKEGQRLVRKYNRHILVTSVDKNHPVANFTRAEQKMKTRPMTYRSGNWFEGYKNYLRYAVYIYNSLDKTDALLVSVTMCRDNVAVRCNTKRLLTVDRCPAYELTMWG